MTLLEIKLAEARKVQTAIYLACDMPAAEHVDSLIGSLTDVIQKMKSALEFYEAKESWEIPDIDPVTGFTGMSAKSMIEHDRGKTARDTLKSCDEMGEGD